MGRPLNIPWQEDAREMFQLYITEYTADEKSEMVPRLRALWLLRMNRSLEEVAEVVEVNYRTLQKWVSWYRKGGIAEIRSHTLAGSGQTSRLEPAQIQILEEKLSQGTLQSPEAVARWVAEIFGVKYTPSGIYSLMRRIQGPRSE